MQRYYGPLFACAIFLLSLEGVANATVSAAAATPARATTFAFIPKLKSGAVMVPYEKTPPALSFSVESTTAETPTSSQNLLTLDLKNLDGDRSAKYKVTINFGCEMNLMAAFKATLEAGAIGYMSVFYDYDSAYSGGPVILPRNLTMEETWVLLRGSKLAVHHPEAGFLIDDPLRAALHNVPTPK